MTTPASKFAGRSLMLIRIGGLAILLGALGYRLGIVGLGLAFGLFGIGFLLSLVTLPMAVITLFVARKIPDVAEHAGLAAIMALVVVAIPVWTLVTGLGAPPITTSRPTRRTRHNSTQ